MEVQTLLKLIRAKVTPGLPQFNTGMGTRPTMGSDYHHQGERGLTSGEGRHEAHRAVGQ